AWLYTTVQLLRAHTTTAQLRPPPNYSPCVHRWMSRCRILPQHSIGIRHHDGAPPASPSATISHIPVIALASICF
ncbi:hypothetical protein GE09DRAFT_1161312, partial [Coniochaeta sp. 2T2.1]